MKLAKIILSSCLIFSATSVGYFLGQNSKVSNAKFENRETSDQKTVNLFKTIEAEKIRTIETNGEDIYYVTREVNEPPFEDSDRKTSEKFLIYDSKGKVFV